MRQIGNLPTERDAHRFTAFLVTKEIDVQAEPDGDAWAIWVRDEDQVAAARAELDAFLAKPTDVRYDEATRAADQLRREAEQRRREASRRVVEMGQRWSRPATRRQPLTLALTILCIVLYILLFWTGDYSPLLGDLTFCRIDAKGQFPSNGWEQIAHGEVWRLVTPAFIHWSIAHLIFNLMALRSLGGMIEQVRGTPRFGLLVLLLAIGSNVVQYLWTGSPLFGGISGVLFGLFGYAWMMTIYRPEDGIVLTPDTVLFITGFFLVCMLRDTKIFEPLLSGVLPKVANAAHAGGLVLGVIIGLVASRWKPR